MSLIGKIGAAPNTDASSSASCCGRSNDHFVHDRVCKLYFRHREGNGAMPLSFAFVQVCYLA